MCKIQSGRVFFVCHALQNSNRWINHFPRFVENVVVELKIYCSLENSEIDRNDKNPIILLTKR